MQATSRALAQKHTRAFLKSFEVIINIVVRGDIDIQILVNLRRFIKDDCVARLCTVERGGALAHKHFK